MTGPSHTRGDAPSDAPSARPETVLLIGREAQGPSQQLSGRNASIVVAPFLRLDAALIARVKPQAVAFPLMGADCDAAQVLALLAELGFSGEAIIFSPKLPNRDMVLRELSPLAPRIARITLLESPEG